MKAERNSMKKRENPLSLCLPVGACTWISFGILLVAWIPVMEAAGVALSGPGKVGLRPSWTSFAAFGYAVNDWSLVEAAGRSLVVALGSALLSVAIGGPVAVAAHTISRRIAALVTLPFLFPLVTPDVMIGLSLGHTLQEWGVKSSILSLIIAHSVFGSALVFFVASASYTVDFTAISENALTLGVAGAQDLGVILARMTRPALFAGGCVAFVVSLDDFAVTYFLIGAGEATLPVTLYTCLSKTLRAEHFAAALVLAIVNATIVIGVLRYFGVRAFGLEE